MPAAEKASGSAGIMMLLAALMADTQAAEKLGGQSMTITS